MTMWAASTIAIQGFGTWVPTLLVKEGVSMDESIVYVTLGTIGAPLALSLRRKSLTVWIESGPFLFYR